jgi:DNA-binding NarL/FixJ family response regulator
MTARVSRIFMADDQQSRDDAGKVDAKDVSMALVRVLLVDDHEIARKGVRSVLATDEHLAIVSEAVDGEGAVKKSEELHPDVILLDISLPGISGIQAAREIRVTSPESKIIFLSQHDSIQIAKDALSVGAQGYVVKSDAGRDLLRAIRTVLEGHTFVSGTLIAKGWI